MKPWILFESVEQTIRWFMDLLLYSFHLVLQYKMDVISNVVIVTFLDVMLAKKSTIGFISFWAVEQ